MTTQKKRIPKKLKNDAIVEAVFEVRFNTDTLPEVLFGRLSDYEPWENFEQKKLPINDFPSSVRESDPKLRFQPLFELREANGAQLVRIGPHVFSYHRLVPYVGWDAFKIELENAVDELCSTTKDIKIRRLGIRYMNAITSDKHGIHSIADLDLDIRVENENLSDDVNLNFKNALENDSEYTMRVATRGFIQGPVPENTTVFADVDVYTQESYKTKDADANQIKQWIEFAHTMEKEQFFRLLTQESIDAMEDK